MSMTERTVQDLLARRRDAAIKIILRAKENECDVYLPVEASTRLRKVVLDQINEFYTLAIDLMGVGKSDPPFEINQLWLDRIEEMHRDIGDLHRELIDGRT